MVITSPRLRFASPALVLSCLALFAALGKHIRRYLNRQQRG
jgi:hypothetical protein